MLYFMYINLEDLRDIIYYLLKEVCEKILCVYFEKYKND